MKHRWLLVVSWENDIRNKTIRKSISAKERVINVEMMRKLQLFGYIFWMKDDHLLKTVLIMSREEKDKAYRKWLVDITEWFRKNLKMCFAYMQGQITKTYWDVLAGNGGISEGCPYLNHPSHVCLACIKKLSVMYFSETVQVICSRA